MRRLALSACLVVFAAVACSRKHGTPAWGYDSRPSTATCLAHTRPPTGSSVQLTPAFAALTFNAPVDMVQRPGSDQWYVVEQAGTVQTFPNDDAVQPAQESTFLDISSTAFIGDSGEGGLLSIAFHPQWATNHEVILSYTIAGPGTPPLITKLSKTTTSADGLSASSAPGSEIFSLDLPYTNHHGGNAVFGADGDLYFGIGDGGSQGDPDNRAQDLGQDFGKMLRFDVDSSPMATAPPDNPFVGVSGALPEIWAYGFRNPWRWSFDSATGALWMGDVGQDTWEEVDVVQPGGNYGWSLKEGFSCYKAPSPCDTGPWTDPIVNYDHTQGNSITGGFVYRGAAIPSLVGTYVYADFGSGTVWGLFYGSNGEPEPQELLPATGINFSSFAQGHDGELYLLDYTNGKIEKLSPATAAPPSDFPQTLSATGCVDAAHPQNAIAGMIPYDVESPLWSDGATKRRWMSVPDGQTITLGTDGDFNFPVGTVLMKEFSVGGKRAETRLLMNATDGWSGYTYQWNDAQTDAALLPADATKNFGAQEWFFPSRAQCLTCHTDAAGRSLGPEVLQLNHAFKYPDGATVNELAQLDHLGMFTTSPGDPTTLPTLFAPTGTTGTLEQRAKSYLHANCSICHRPGGTNQANWDGRFEIALHDMGVCNADPLEGDLGVTGAKLMVPGDPTHSLISLRMHATDSDKMPPIGRHVVDTQGAAVVDAWITSLSSCP